jgi:hypothetical protein
MHTFWEKKENKPAQRIALASLLLLGWGIYTYNLTSKPLWWDEGISLYTATLGWLEVIRTTIQTDVHPPAIICCCIIG